MRFADRLRHAVDAANSLLCVGLDPQPERTAADELLSFNRGVIEAAGEFVCAFKPQSAFYEAAGELGWDALARTIELIRELAPHAVVVLDAKRGDIANTARAYASAAFELLGADAITASPYLGADSVAPFLEHPERGAFVLCRTSNPGSGDFQSLRILGPEAMGAVGARRRSTSESPVAPRRGRTIFTRTWGWSWARPTPLSSRACERWLPPCRSCCPGSARRAAIWRRRWAPGSTTSAGDCWSARRAR